MALCGALSLAAQPAAARPERPQAPEVKPVPAAAPGLTLGQALDGIGAFEEVPIPGAEALMQPPPPPARTGALILLWTGGLAGLAGVAGTALSPTCETEAVGGRCVDERGPAAIWPALIALGLGVMVTGAYWYRQDVAEPGFIPPPPLADQ